TSNWNMGINAWDFGYSQRVQSPRLKIYMYTDRPIYRPGQTVYYRGVVRQAFNGRYELPTVNSVPVILNDAQGTQLANLNAQLSPYGTFNGQFELSQDAVPGYYTFFNSGLEFYLSFQVAEYRKPEINLDVKFASAEIRQGDPASANVNARYFFDAPAGNVDVRWSLYTKPDYFHIPNYQTGLIETDWLNVFRFPTGVDSGYLGRFLNEGTAQTSPGGTLTINLTAIPESDAPQLLTLEATATDETGLPVSARSELRIHPSEFYIGLRPEQWVGEAKSALGFEVYTVDWEGNASGGRVLTAEFKQVRWEKETDSAGFPTYKPVYLPGSSSNLATGPDGKARLSFIPPNAGTYVLDVSGDGARSQVLVWVRGAGTAAWPDLPNQRLELTADKDSYNAGDTAKVFIPNPFPTSSIALVTVERGLVSKAETIQLTGSGTEYSLPITDDDAPNVYLSVTALGQGNDFRHGLVNLPVAPEAQELKVQLFSNPPEAGPRDQVTFDVVVTDHQDQPVQGEFSLSVVDLATLALADPNAEDILPAFYSNQPLGVETGLSLAAYGGRDALEPGGLGGGGGEEAPFVREDFPDTAYWNRSPPGRWTCAA
ncbi:MAG: MG2 domain-containing protein, partial [Anaerolineales bacterium]|nr:MG2 domain-containing protein [Anaerolineales bacterium]